MYAVSGTVLWRVPGTCLVMSHRGPIAVVFNLALMPVANSPEGCT